MDCRRLVQGKEEVAIVMENTLDNKRFLSPKKLFFL